MLLKEENLREIRFSFVLNASKKTSQTSIRNLTFLRRASVFFLSFFPFCTCFQVLKNSSAEYCIADAININKFTFHERGKSSSRKLYYPAKSPTQIPDFWKTIILLWERRRKNKQTKEYQDHP